MAKLYLRKKKKKINWGFWVTAALVFLMVSSTIGFITFQGGDTSLTYEGYKFTQTPQGYRVMIDDVSLVFQYFPDSVDDIEVPRGVMDTLLSSRVLAVTYDPNDEEKEALGLIQYNLFKILEEFKNIYVVRGLVNNTGYDLPQLGCENATSQPVVLLQSGNDTSFVKEDGCVIITGGTGIQLALVHDRLLYGILGVIS